MPRVRPELIKGLGALGMFLALIVVTSVLLPFPITQSNYTFVDLSRVEQNPLPFNERNISSRATVVSILVMGGQSFVFTIENVPLQIDTFEAITLTHGDRIFFRGTLHTHNQSSITVIVHEFYVLDYNSSIIRSIPGIILFIVMFFLVFTIDFKHLAFLPRRSRDA